MRFFIYVDEKIYNSRKGIYECAAIDAADTTEAKQIATNFGWLLINGFNNYFQDIADEDIHFQTLAFPIRKDVALTTLQLDKICANMDRENFIRKFCKEGI